jgi:hypothetical protein
VAKGWLFGIDDQKTAGHPKMHHERAVAVEVQEEILPSSPDSCTFGPGQGLSE